MFILAPVLISTVIVGTLGFGSYATNTARETVLKVNLQTIGQVLLADKITDGVFPKDLGQLLSQGDVSNLNPNDYVYLTLDDKSEAALYGYYGGKVWCWTSKDQTLKVFSSGSLCRP